MWTRPITDVYKRQVDYLLKPISYADFLTAANKAFEWFELKRRSVGKPSPAEEMCIRDRADAGSGRCGRRAGAVKQKIRNTDAKRRHVPPYRKQTRNSTL